VVSYSRLNLPDTVSHCEFQAIDRKILHQGKTAKTETSVEYWQGQSVEKHLEKMNKSGPDFAR